MNRPCKIAGLLAALLLTAACEGEMRCQGAGGDGCTPGQDTAVDDLAETSESVEARPDTPDGRPDPAETTDPDAEAPEGDAPADPPEDPAEEEEPPPPPVTYSFVVFGDDQMATGNCTSGVPERLAIPQAILELAPTLLLSTGDLMDHGYDDGAYDSFQTCYAEMLATIPFFPTGGNHDYGSGAVWNYKDYVEEQLFTENPAVWGPTYDTDFDVFYEDDPTDYCTSFSSPCHQDVVPSGVSFKTFFAYRYENAYFLSFEVGTVWWTNTPTTWVEDHLDRARSDPAIRHIFVHLHHPQYSTTMAEVSDSDTDGLDRVREAYEGLFRQYDVTMVFSGHAHVYDRFYVPDDGTPTRSRPPPPSYPNDGNAVHYIVTGGGGGPLPSGCSPAPGEREEYSYDFSQQRGCGYHVTLVEVEGDRLTVSIIGVSGNEDSYTTDVWDTFTIE